jgi:hypothetical protein
MICEETSFREIFNRLSRSISFHWSDVCPPHLRKEVSYRDPRSPLELNCVCGTWTLDRKKCTKSSTDKFLKTGVKPYLNWQVTTFSGIERFGISSVFLPNQCLIIVLEQNILSSKSQFRTNYLFPRFEFSSREIRLFS